MLITIESRHDVETLGRELEAAAKRHEFGVLGVHDLRAKLREKGQDYDRACLVFDVCNPVQASRVLRAEPRVSAALPCRISVFEREDGRTEMVTIRPTEMIGLFQTAELETVAREVERTLTAIMREASGRA